MVRSFFISAFLERTDGGYFKAGGGEVGYLRFGDKLKCGGLCCLAGSEAGEASDIPIFGSIINEIVEELDDDGSDKCEVTVGQFSRVQRCRRSRHSRSSGSSRRPREWACRSENNT